MCNEEERASREVMRGISQFSREHGHWAFVHRPRRLSALEAVEARAPAADGIILRAAYNELDQLLQRVPPECPVVTFMNRHDGSRAPVVTDDEQLIAETAIKHLMGAGLRRFAFVDHYNPHSLRSDAFVACAEAHGFECQVIALRRLSEVWSVQLEKMGEWLVELKKPVGVLAFESALAAEVATACQEVSLRVPDEVAILATGDDLCCEMAWPQISAIDMDFLGMGWEAAAMLEALMRGETLPHRRAVVKPRGVIKRHSTDVLAIDDPRVADAVRFIRSEVAAGIKVDDVMREVLGSRRTLEHAFLRHLGHSIHAEITRARIQLTQQMIATTDLALEDIAARCGFSDRTRLSSIFRRETGLTPKAYRQQSRRGRSKP